MVMSKTEENDLKMFAAAALQGTLAALGDNRTAISQDLIARIAWGYAQAMIASAPGPISFAYGHGEKP